MEIPVYIEPTANGFRAVLAGPWNISAEAQTADLAVGAVKVLLSERLVSGCEVRTIPVHDRLLESLARLSTNPFLDEWDEATREARRQIEAEEEARERELEATRNGHAETHKAEPATADSQP